MAQDEIELRVRFQIALLGEVSPSLRAVVAFQAKKAIRFVAYFDGAVSSEDEESMTVVETEVLASYPTDFETSHRIVRLDWPARIPRDGVFVYHRREWDRGGDESGAGSPE